MADSLSAFTTSQGSSTSASFRVASWLSCVWQTSHAHWPCLLDKQQANTKTEPHRHIATGSARQNNKAAVWSSTQVLVSVYRGTLEVSTAKIEYVPAVTVIVIPIKVVVNVLTPNSAVTCSHGLASQSVRVGTSSQVIVAVSVKSKQAMLVGKAAGSDWPCSEANTETETSPFIFQYCNTGTLYCYTGIGMTF